LATTDKNNMSQYFLLTDMKGNPIHNDLLTYIGKPSKIAGVVEKMEDWYFLKLKTSDIIELNKKSLIY